jgi:DNA polymerase II small subunit/DNA polymerase delta subunit B
METFSRFSRWKTNIVGPIRALEHEGDIFKKKDGRSVDDITSLHPNLSQNKSKEEFLEVFKS